MPEGFTDPLVERASRLFEFLTKVQQVTAPPVRHVDSYADQGGLVTWVHDFPNHAAISEAARRADPEPGQPFLAIDRVPRADSPSPPTDLAPWIAGTISQPDAAPSLKDRAVLAPDEPIGGELAELPATVLRLEDSPEVERAFQNWLEDWEAWARQELAARPVRELYQRIFTAQISHENASEDWEAVAAIGAVAWHPRNHDPVVRHCLTFPAEFDFDDDTGRLTVKPAEDGELSVELDMLDLGLWPERARLDELKEAAGSYTEHPWHRDAVSTIVRRLTNHLSADGRYLDDDQPAGPDEALTCSFAPAIILRKRSHRGLIEIFQTIKAQLEERGTVPPGLQVLLDPDLAPAVSEVADPTTGAWVEDGDDVYLPLPVNERQLDVIRRVDRAALTLVQGPPGTGKTHTAAALISHLLAQGKRVLVTAQTDQALKEVRGKLPATIRDLSVSVVGAGQKEMADLKVAVRTLSQASGEYSPEESDERTTRALTAIEDLKRRKSSTARALLESREAETLRISHAGYEGTLAEIASSHVDQADRLGWLDAMADIAPDAVPPISDQEALELLTLLRDSELRVDEPEAQQDLPHLNELTDPDTYADQLEKEARAAARAAALEIVRDHDAYGAIASLDPADRGELRQRIDELAAHADTLARRDEQWLAEALTDVRAGRLQVWESRYQQVAELTSRARPLLAKLGPMVDVTVAGANPKALLPHAAAVREYLAGGRMLKLDPATQKPKQGLLSAKVLKDAEPLFEQVNVNGLPPTSVEALDLFATWVAANGVLEALDRSWLATMAVPSDGSLTDRLSWHEAELQVLAKVMSLGRDLNEEQRRLDELGVPKPDWNDLDGVRHFAGLVDAADAAETHAAARRPLDALAEQLADAARWSDAPSSIRRLRDAVHQKDADLYRAAYQRLQRLADVRVQARRRNELTQKLRSGNATLARQLIERPDDDRWDPQLAGLGAAWRWAATASWIKNRSAADLNDLQASYNSVEDKLRAQVAELASVRAWSKAVHRLGQQQRADLMQYAQLVQSFGKTGGKYAVERQREMRDAMRRCRPAVPVWIMPLYRISQALSIDADLFDVIVIDEASQAGLEATFLQYLAPKIVVIGDDKQNSPRAVGVDQQQLRDLANHYLYDDRYKASWQDPKRSLFDEARMRFGDLITLTEHRRCVPDIIGFSNRIAYEPEGIRLVPVRQTGGNALPAVRPVYVQNGYVKGSSNRINPVEVEAIVDQLEKCLADEAYDGLTFGVISLTGANQAKAIEKALMDRIDPREWQARDLRCGTAPDFRGSERNVMFLSMVAALNSEGRFPHAALIADMYIQQFNVAASRALDQMWVFHSVRPDELTNRDDMRYQLLDYCYSVSRRSLDQREGHATSLVPEDRLVSPFDSLFEQRVHNRIFDRGHTVIPQYPVGPYKIDLVVVGFNGRLAVECDGDRWHGPDRWQQDTARQRELQRSGWQFFRVRESEFIIDPAGALAPLWALLDELEDVTTAPTVTPPVDSAPPQAPIVEQTELVPAGVSFEAAEEDHVSPADLRTPAQSDNEVADATPPPGPPPPPVDLRSSSAQEVEEKPELIDATAAASEPTGTPPLDLAAVYATPSAYNHWDTATVLQDVNTATPQQLRDGLRRIVEVEGPIIGQRLYLLYVQSSGGSRVGSAVRRILNRTVHRMVQDGGLIADDPLNAGGQLPKTYRLAGQPPVTVRQLGQRTIHEVPPLELAARIRAERQHGDRGDDTYRRVLNAYGLTRLSTATRETLGKAAKLAEDDDS